MPARLSFQLLSLLLKINSNVSQPFDENNHILYAHCMLDLIQILSCCIQNSYSISTFIMLFSFIKEQKSQIFCAYISINGEKSCMYSRQRMSHKQIISLHPRWSDISIRKQFNPFHTEIISNRFGSFSQNPLFWQEGFCAVC